MAKSENIMDFMKAFPDEESCIEYLEELRWGGRVVSPFDPSSKVYRCRNHRWRCKNTGKYFNVKTGTFMEGTKLPLSMWFYAILYMTTLRRGKSSHQLAYELGVTQKTAWRMVNLIRGSMFFRNCGVLSSEVEIDETFVGGKNRNRHRDKKVKHSQGRSFKDKIPVFGIYERKGDMVAKVVDNTQAETLLPHIRKHIKEESRVFTDGWEYGELKKSYEQKSVDHGKGLYGMMAVTPKGELVLITTNGIECAWSHFKRMITGTYYHISRKHMQKYVDEFIFRYNTRRYGISERFELLLRSA